MSPVLVSTIARVGAALVLLALAAGLQRQLIVCTPDDGPAHVEFACGDECGDHDHGGAAATLGKPRVDGEAEAPTPDRLTPPGCRHAALSFELAPASKSAPMLQVTPAAIDAVTMPDLGAAPSRHAPGDYWQTGPPGDRRALHDQRVIELRE